MLISLVEGCKSIDFLKDGWRRIASASVIVCCMVYVLRPHEELRYEAAADVLELFMLNDVDPVRKRSDNLEFLLTGFPKELR